MVYEFLYYILEYSSCSEASETGEDGVYLVNLGGEKPVRVFCEFHIGYGLMFISTKAFKEKNSVDFNKIKKLDKAVAIFRSKGEDGKQFDSIIYQLSNFSNLEFAFLNSKFDSFTCPYNTHLGPYIFIGVIPRALINEGTVQGYASNRLQHTFVNSKEYRNSYFVFYPNLDKKEPVQIPPCCPLVGAWLQRATPAPIELSKEFFYLVEEHMGGGGARGISSQIGVEGVALGMRFPLDNGKY